MVMPSIVMEEPATSGVHDPEDPLKHAGATAKFGPTNMAINEDRFDPQDGIGYEEIVNHPSSKKASKPTTKRNQIQIGSRKSPPASIE